MTFDADYADIASYKGHPPKITWLRMGNTTTDNIAEILVRNKELIIDFVRNEETACLEIL